MDFCLNRSLFVLIGVVALSIGSQPTTSASPKNEAKVTQVAEDVQLVDVTSAVRPAAINDSIGQGTEVRTGAKSRAELTFADQTLARLGAETAFKFKGGARNWDMSSGAMLVQVPKRA